jgi:hypothetical protein
MVMGKQFPDNILPQPSGTSRDDDPHGLIP